MDYDQSGLITLLGNNCLFRTSIYNSSCETITQEHLLSSMPISNCVSILIFAVADPGISNGEGEGEST